MPNPQTPGAEIGNLTIFKDPTGVMTVQRGRSPARYSQVIPDDKRVEAIAAGIHVALALLESPAGKSRLLRTATKILENRINRGDPHVYNDRLERLRYWVDQFLHEMGSDFPNVYLTNTVWGEAKMRKWEWGRDIRRYNAKAAGILQINKMLVDNMVAVGHKALTYKTTSEEGYRNSMLNWETYIFQFGISIAHEIVHFLAGFLTGTPFPDTPPAVTYAGFGDDVTGESGCHWEGYWLGGIVDFYEDSRDPLGSLQAGVPVLSYTYIGNNRQETIRWVRISQDYIRRFVDMRFDASCFPAQPASGAPAMDPRVLRQRYGRNMADFRAGYLPRGTALRAHAQAFYEILHRVSFGFTAIVSKAQLGNRCCDLYQSGR
ncbi:hypothetical protein QQX98_005355 [Neonectria punicea]|uniref:Uncharacterized protein n=1 Tax=Neonectria punicea TaxID=979145 RepID=A0ABR1H4Y1_9HYPO